MTVWACARLVAALLLCVGADIVHAVGTAGENTSAALRARYGALQGTLNHNPYGRPLHLDSGESHDGVWGDIHARMSYPFAMAGTALSNPGNWCDILILHLNIKYCRTSTRGEAVVLGVSIGKKHDQALDEAYRVMFAYRVAARTQDYLQVRLNASEGPLGTRDYRIVLEALPLEDGQTFILENWRCRLISRLPGVTRWDLP
jgi:hypothetical protein